MQNVERGGELVVRAARRECGGGDRRLDAQSEQPALDAVGAPPVEAAAILGEAAGEACVVEVLQALELGDRAVDPGRLDALALEMAADLGHRAVAVAEVAIAEVERVLKLSLRVRRPRDQLAHAAWSRAGTRGVSAPGTAALSDESIGVTRSRSISSAS